jgi:hypothetical protein
VTDKQFEECQVCSAVGRFIAGLAKQYGKKTGTQEDLSQEAWLGIAGLPACPGTEGCKDIARALIRSAFRQDAKLSARFGRGLRLLDVFPIKGEPDDPSEPDDDFMNPHHSQ